MLVGIRNKAQEANHMFTFEVISMDSSVMWSGVISSLELIEHAVLFVAFNFTAMKKSMLLCRIQNAVSRYVTILKNN